ncbi:PREDICTED: ARF guanine-nucleotide exchange factor GNL1 [Brassica oleracea var. oleracea]|uniref:SEC7 domain-containing protein n=1 Tax=Brassica oleracea var. oleracea TaxID=109376 RepID=A0A0D2ZPU4_BRAOL|nr:PREDICTED: ARF guanine-nucleotide exchange factor GNL1 [Brassica oleracea var. oleracea]
MRYQNHHPSGSRNSFHGGEFNKPSKVAVASMINSEIGAVLAVMRRNVRWGVRYIADDDQLEHSLIHSLKELRKQIFSWQSNWQNVDPNLYIQPFLDVILSDETGAPITGVALSSVYKILTLDVFTLDTVNVGEAMHIIVDAVKSCRFEVTDPASEEVVLMKILQVLLACIKCKAASGLSNQDICTIVNTCLRVVHQSSSKSELLQRIARHTMHELVRCIFSQLPYISPLANESELPVGDKVGTVDWDQNSGENTVENGSIDSVSDTLGVEKDSPSSEMVIPETVLKKDEKGAEVSDDLNVAANGENAMLAPFGIPCMVEIFHFLCTLLNIGENSEVNSRSNPIAFDEDVPLFALGLINSAIELGGSSFREHPKLLSLIQDELFCNLMQFGMSMSPLILSTVCSIVLNLYLTLRTELKVQLEAFFSCVLLRIAQSKHGSSYQQQEVAMEALVDFCRQPTFMAEMFANFDCDITCSNVFEDVSNLLSKSAFPVNGPLSAMHIIALDGLISMVQGMAERVGEELPGSNVSTHEEGYEAFWTVRCENYGDPNLWVPFVRKSKHIKKKLMVGADHFNSDPKKGLQQLQAMHLLPEELDPKSVACFFRYTCGIDKNLIGDFLGNHDQFCVQVLHEFAKTFDFQNMNLDNALRLFVGTFRLPGESQKIQRVLEAFSERYYEQSPQILIDKDAALLLSYSIILLNTDHHNTQVKKKMTEEDFIRNNRCINGGADLPREYLSELYHSICDSEIQMIPDQGTGFQMMTSSRWISVIYKSKETGPYIICDSASYLDRDMFHIVSGPTIAATSVVFEQAEQEDVLQRCVDGLLAIAKLSAYYHLNSVLDDLVVSLCKFTPFFASLSVDEAVLAIGEDARARMATETVFLIANKYGDYITSGWKNILECVLSLHKLQILPAHIASDAADDPEEERPLANPLSVVSQVQPSETPRKSSSFIGRFSQLLSFDMEETKPLLPTEEELAAYKHARGIVKDCHIDSIFSDSKFLQAESLQQLVNSLIKAAAKDKTSAVFCLELLIAVTLNNRDRILLIWQTVYEHISGIVQSTTTPCPLVEKAVFGVLKICQRLLPYKENLTDELLKLLQLVLKLDARVADAYCEPITQEVARLVKANASHVRSHVGWRTIISLISITARHPEASDAGFEALRFIMSEGAHLLLANYILCSDAARQFAESRVGEIDRSISAIDLMSNSVFCLARWSQEAKNSVGEDEAMRKLSQDIGEMWLRLVNNLKRVCLDQRDQVRNHAISMLQRSIAGADGIMLPQPIWFQCFDAAIFPLLDELLAVSIENSRKTFKKTVEETLVLATKLMSKAFLQALQDISQQPSFCRLWLGVLDRMETYMSTKFRGKRSEKVHELIPELLKNTLLVMKTTGVLLPGDDIGSDSFWQLTWLHVKKISPSLQSEVFPQEELDQFQRRNAKPEDTPVVPEH